MTFQVHQPRSVTEAVQLAASLGPGARFLAGGTDLIVQINRRRCTPQHLIALDRIGGLSGIDIGETEIHIAALNTHKTIERHPAFCGPLCALAEAARVIGGHQVRNIGTIGGNIVNASPAADLLPVLLTLAAQVTLTGSERTRQIPLVAFLSGPGTTTRRADEVLTHVSVACAPPNSATAFIKAGRRRAMEISVVSVAAFLVLDLDRRCRVARIGLGAVGPTALRATAAEHMLQGQHMTEPVLRQAGRLAAAACTPISDVRASAEYRQMLVQALVPRALQRCVDRIGAMQA